MLNIKTSNGNLYITGDTFTIKDQIKFLPATLWNKKLKAYVMPATVGAARNIGTLRQLISSDDGFKALCHLLQAQNEAQEVKRHACSATCPAWHHQGEALDFAFNQPAVIFNMPTGTGKTKTVLDLMVKRGHRLILVTTKKKAVGVWKKDANKFYPGYFNIAQLDTGSVVKNMKLAQEAVAASDGQPTILVINYQAIWRNPFKNWILKQPVDFMVMDESHVIKAPGSKASMFMKRMRAKVAALAALTATFFGDKPVDMYGQMRAIDPAVFGTSFKRFKEDYCYMGGFDGRQIVGYKDQDKMMEKLAPYIFQVDKAVLQLIPVRHKTYYCKYSAADLKMFSNFAANGITRLPDGQTVSVENILTRLLRSQQMACGFIQPDSDDGEVLDIVSLNTGKIDLLQEVLEDLVDSEDVPVHCPVVVYARFTEDLRRIEALAKSMGYNYGEISGGRDDQELFKTNQINFLGCQISAGGTGVDGLQEAAHIGIYYSTGHSLTEFIQSQGRLDRPGQYHSVLNIYLVGADTIDEDIVKALRNKEDVIKMFEAKLKTLAKSDT